MGGGGRRPDTSHESKRAPECHPPIPLIAARALYDTEAVVQDIVMKSLMRRIEPVGLFCCVVARGKGAIFAPILASNIDSTPLNKMPCQSTARRFVFERTAAELRIE
jgi:hypothetical protein